MRWAGAVFAAVCLVAVGATATLARLLPQPPAIPVATISQRMALLGNRQILPVILTTFVFFVGGFAVYTYIWVDPIGGHAERPERVTLRGQILLVGRDARVADPDLRHAGECPKVPSPGI